MKNLIIHSIRKLFATKFETPCRNSLEEVEKDINHLKNVYSGIGMKLIDVVYKEHIAKKHTLENDRIWLTKTYMSYAIVYFIKE